MWISILIIHSIQIVHVVHVVQIKIRINKKLKNKKIKNYNLIQ